MMWVSCFQFTARILFVFSFLCSSLSLYANAQDTHAAGMSTYDEFDDEFEEENDDPWYSMNRKIFSFNSTIDRILLKPLAKGYRKITPGFVEKSIGNFFSNLGEVNNLVNSALQGDINQSGVATGRLLVNSTIGLAGFMDVASKWGMEERKEDFGQTLAVWGVSDGPYIMLPFLGSSTVRDAFGRIPDTFLSPVTYVDDDDVRAGLIALDVVDTRAEYLDAEALITGDKYTFIREVYLQTRESAIANGEVTGDEFGDEFDEDF